ncbi:MAG: hypothetical protein Q7R69_00715 [bacterium]|nr:hypothetical protein [bacterium]
MFTEEELEPLQKIADRNAVAVITFIASDKLIRINPASYSSVSISTNDVYKLEEEVDKNCQNVKKAFLLLHSPGGSLSSAYNIARFLRKRFDFLHVFVPYEAASGATLMSLAGNNITLGDLGYLTPIDPQIRYRGEWVSSYGIIEKVNDIERKFKKMTPDEMPIPWKQMVEKIDIVHYREMETIVWEAQFYADELLELAGYDKNVARDISRDLARNTFSHGHCYDRDACKDMGLKIEDSKNSDEYLTELKKLIHIVNKKDDDASSHYIDVIAPKKLGSTKEDAGPKKTVVQPKSSAGARARTKK